MHFGAQPHLFEKAQKLRSKMTVPEKILWNRLKDRIVFKMKWRRQHPMYRYILDFYCHEYKIALEIDGPDHKYIMEYDAKRTEEINSFGVKVYRFSNEEVYSKLDTVISKIKNILNSSK